MLQLDFKPWSSTIKSYCLDGNFNEALSLFLALRCSSGFHPSHQVFAAVLKSCVALSSLKLGKAIHGYTFKQGLFSCHSVSKGLLNVYAKCGSPDDAHNLFDEMPKCDSVMWNIILSGFSGSRIHDAGVMRLFCAMHIGGEAKPNPITIATILPVCARLGHVDAGKTVHSYVVKSGLETDTLVGNALVSMYAKCGLVFKEACAAFNSISYKDVVSWNAIISGLAENKLMDDAFQLFGLMLKEPMEPNYATIANILPVCASFVQNIAYWSGREIHGYVQRRSELMQHVSVSNALMSFYLRVRRVEQAETLFQKTKIRDLVSWNAIIAGYASNGEWLKAVALFHELLSLESYKLDSVTIVSILPVCTHLQNLEMGKKIHGYIFRRSSLREDSAVGNALVSFYAKCNNVEEAFKIFLMISNRDMISWNSMLNAFSESGNETQFLELLHWMMRERTKPDDITILTIIDFFVGLSKVEKIKETHCHSIKAGFLVGDSYPVIGKAILDAYAKCCNVEYAFRIFKSLSKKRNPVSCDSVISGYGDRGSHDDAYTIFSVNSQSDLTTWNLMIRAYAENNCPDCALNLFRELHTQGMKPDMMTIMSLLPICSQMASVHLLRQCHGYVVRASFEDVHLNGALLDIYAKCGFIGFAYRLFQSSLHKDLVLFTAMISGYAMHGLGEEALKVFNQMLALGEKPDEVILTAVLSACSHAGLVHEGLQIFDSIEKVHDIKPTMNQYACVVDLLARGGWINDAYSFVIGMPIEANANIWGTLLGACKTHHEVELGSVVAERLFQIEANNIGNYVVMSNLYAANARWDGVLRVRKLMRTRDLKKPAGCSWIEVDGRKNIFIAGDFSHPERSCIYSMSSTLDQQIKEPVSFDIDNGYSNGIGML